MNNYRFFPQNSQGRYRFEMPVFCEKLVEMTNFSIITVKKWLLSQKKNKKWDKKAQGTCI